MPYANLIEMSLENLNYYEVLDVPSTANQDEIYQAYKDAQLTFSLSNTELYKVFTQSEAQAWLGLIEEAYSIIGSPNSRRAYDRELAPPTGLAQSLPSFELDNHNEEAKRTPEAEQEATPLPDGFAETKISRYPLSKKMEDLISHQEVFDGLFLKKIREYKNIDLTDFSKHTCIAIRHLYAIENNNYSVLPAAVFVRGYIIQYCRVLELKEEQVVPSFMNLFSNER